MIGQLATAIGLAFLGLMLGCQNESTDTLRSKSETSSEHNSRTLSPPPKPIPAVLKVATYNSNWGNQHFQEIVELLRQTDADVIALQETTPRLESALKRQLGGIYPYQRYSGFQWNYAGEGFGFLAKRPLRQVRFVPPQHGYFGFFMAELPCGKRTCKLINVHLQPFEVVVARDLFQQMAAIETCHQWELAEILKHASPDQPTLIVGDFNSPSQFCVPTELRKQNYQDSFASQFPSLEEADQHATWHWPMEGTELKLRIDYIFHNKHWATKSSHIGRNCHSDHHLLISELQLQEEDLSLKAGESRHDAIEH